MVKHMRVRLIIHSMNRIESLIFNELASHRAVLLPRVGTLGVVRRNARTHDNGQIEPPETKVIYSPQTDGNSSAITALGVDEGEYAHWLENAFRNDELVIDGVGELVLGEFTPSHELELLLNPASGAGSSSVLSIATPPPLPAETAVAAPTASDVKASKEEVREAVDGGCESLADMSTRAVDPVAAPTTGALRHSNLHKNMSHTTVTRASNASSTHTTSVNKHNHEPRRNKNCTTNILLIIVIVLLLAILGLYLWRTFCVEGEKNVELTTRVQVEEPVVQDVAPVLATPPKPAFHLIAGSFDDTSRAEKQAAQYRRRYPNLTVTTLDNGAGRTLVSVFEGRTQREAYNTFYRIAEQTGNWDMWVYETSSTADASVFD